MNERERLRALGAVVAAQSDLDRAVRRSAEGYREAAFDDVVAAVTLLAEVVGRLVLAQEVDE
jgi:hypothetical protein